MGSACVIDTETTGIEEPDVIELAWSSSVPMHSFPLQDLHCRRFRPRKPITLGALATHHILDEWLEHEPEWPGHWMPPGEYLIGHNVDFDWKAIGSPPMKRICTLALARSLWPELDSHSLGALTYQFMPREEARELLRNAHGAVRDVELCVRVLTQVLRAIPQIKDWENLWQLSEHARVPLRMSFGKYGPYEAWAKQNGGKGMLCAEVHGHDPSYWNWLMSKCDQVRDDPYLAKALRA